jgi:hypothetical protein
VVIRATNRAGPGCGSGRRPPRDFFNDLAVAWLALELTGSNPAVGAILAAAAVPRAALKRLGNAFMTLSRFGPTVLGPALGGVPVAAVGACSRW